MTPRPVVESTVIPGPVSPEPAYSFDATLPAQSDGSLSTLRPVSLTPPEAEVLSFLLPLSVDYPDIERWYRTKVVPEARIDRRLLLRVERQGELVGVGIAKSEPRERKICTVRVAPSHFGRGIGVRIFDTLLRWLDVDRPHLTVSDAKLPHFERIFDYYGFSLTSIHHGLYVRNAREFAFNECPPSPLLLSQTPVVSAIGPAHACG